MREILSTPIPDVSFKRVDCTLTGESLGDFLVTDTGTDVGRWESLRWWRAERTRANISSVCCRVLLACCDSVDMYEDIGGEWVFERSDLVDVIFVVGLLVW